jgi:transcription initiation factor TFIIIB Brf1 subunit/transcription initiation factor TFIIB
MQHCTNCGATNKFVTDDREGARICTNCGAVAEDRMIQYEEPEYRIFDEENKQHKQRVGPPQSIYDLDISNPEHTYLKALKQNTDDILSCYYFRGEHVPKLILCTAWDVVEKAYRIQKRQKESGVLTNKDSEKTRKKYSYRIIIIVCGCYVALQTGQTHVNIDRLCNQASNYVSHSSFHMFATPKTTAVLRMLQKLNCRKDSRINTCSYPVPKRPQSRAHITLRR